MFNNNSTKKNMILASSVSSICKFINIFAGFVYRSIFLHVLSVSYLGLNGLFTNILSMLSLAELGITVSITYRFYKPIAEGDEKRVGQLMNLLKKVYFNIFWTITLMGMMLVPFLKLLIKDTSEIPSDINVYLIYILFLLSSSTSYLYAYKLTILTADQKQHIFALLQCISSIIKYVVQVIVLFLTKDFTFVLAVSVLSTLLTNYLFSFWVERKYINVFSEESEIEKDEKKEIFNDVRAVLCHKIGQTVKNATDNIVISKFVGLVSTGIYSNYAIVVSGLTSVMSQAFGTFTSSFGNSYVNLSKEENYNIFKKTFFLNMFVGIITTECLLLLLDDFIVVWIGNDMVLDKLTMIVVCIQYYIECSRYVSISYTTASGLFIKDKIRPLIESGLNLIISIILVRKIGVAGVFIGTIVSQLLTVGWREPYLLFKFAFEKKIIYYWIIYFEYTFVCLLSSIVLYSFKQKIDFLPTNFLEWIGEAVVVLLITCAINILYFSRKNEFKFYLNNFSDYMKRRKRR